MPNSENSPIVRGQLSWRSFLFESLPCEIDLARFFAGPLSTAGFVLLEVELRFGL